MVAAWLLWLSLACVLLLADDDDDDVYCGYDCLSPFLAAALPLLVSFAAV